MNPQGYQNFDTILILILNRHFMIFRFRCIMRNKILLPTLLYIVKQLFSKLIKDGHWCGTLKCFYLNIY